MVIAIDLTAEFTTIFTIGFGIVYSIEFTMTIAIGLK